MNIQNFYCQVLTHCCSGQANMPGRDEKKTEQMKNFESLLSLKDGNKQSTGSNQNQSEDGQFNTTEVNNMSGVDSFSNADLISKYMPAIEGEMEVGMEEMMNGLQNANNEMKKENAKTAALAAIKGAKISF